MELGSSDWADTFVEVLVTEDVELSLCDLELVDLMIVLVDCWEVDEMAD